MFINFLENIWQSTKKVLGMLIRKPDLVRITPEDPIPGYLGGKVIGGEGITITKKFVPSVGLQAVISQDKPSAGSSGDVVKVSGVTDVPRSASLVLIDATNEPAIITLPHPAEVLGWISVVALSVNYPITLKSPYQQEMPEQVEVLMENPISTSIFDVSNIEFTAAGDAIIFASDRLNTWYCVGRYHANWYA